MNKINGLSHYSYPIYEQLAPFGQSLNICEQIGSALMPNPLDPPIFHAGFMPRFASAITLRHPVAPDRDGAPGGVFGGASAGASDWSISS